MGGALFSVILPWAILALTAAAAACSDSGRGGTRYNGADRLLKACLPAMPKRIAIVEDEAELASLIEYNLTRTATKPRSGRRRALRALEQARPDLILLDVMLPDMDGFELCRQIRASTARPHAGAIPDRALRRGGPRARPGNRRRRLHDQALQPARTDRAREGASASRRDGCRAGRRRRSAPSAWTARRAASSWATAKSR